MSERRGVIVTLFDLPVKSSTERKLYTAFRKLLLQHGYRYFQRSVYIKLLRNISYADREMRLLDSEAPQDGSLQAISMSLNVFRGLTALRGEEFDMSLFADDVVFIGNDEEGDAEEIDDKTLLKMERECTVSRPSEQEQDVDAEMP